MEEVVSSNSVCIVRSAAGVLLVIAEKSFKYFSINFLIRLFRQDLTLDEGKIHAPIQGVTTFKTICS